MPHLPRAHRQTLRRLAPVCHRPNAGTEKGPAAPPQRGSNSPSVLCFSPALPVASDYITLSFIGKWVPCGRGKCSEMLTSLSNGLLENDKLHAFRIRRIQIVLHSVAVLQPRIHNNKQIKPAPQEEIVSLTVHNNSSSGGAGIVRVAVNSASCNK